MSYLPNLTQPTQDHKITKLGFQARIFIPMFLLFPTYTILKKFLWISHGRFSGIKQFSVLRKLTLYIEDNLQNIRLQEMLQIKCYICSIVNHRLICPSNLNLSTPNPTGNPQQLSSLMLFTFKYRILRIMCFVHKQLGQFDIFLCKFQIYSFISLFFHKEK